jgi:hypothetical protein
MTEALREESNGFRKPRWSRHRRESLRDRASGAASTLSYAPGSKYAG